MDTRIATSAELAVYQTAVFMPGAVRRAGLGATSREIENMRRLQPGRMMDADTTSASSRI
jgi:hypothetical protein